MTTTDPRSYQYLEPSHASIGVGGRTEVSLATLTDAVNLQLCHYKRRMSAYVTLGVPATRV